MKSVIASVTASVLESARAILAREAEWPDTATGFAHFICTRARSQPPDFMDQPLRATSSGMLRRTPELAAFGYVIRNAEPEAQRMWLAAVDHLRGREVYPADRQSFIVNPTELLGIAVGVADISTASDGHSEWLITTIRRGLNAGYFKTPLTEIAAIAAARHIDSSFNTPGPKSVDLSGMATSELILMAGIELAFPTLEDHDHSVEHEVLHRVLREVIALNDAADAVTVGILVQKAADLLMVRANDSTPLERVVGICRRFHLFAKSLEQRQRNRTTVVINDEYDVQDFLLAILRLHFDDVRPEECTPSYASRSSRLDFLIPAHNLIIEAKMTRSNLGQREVVDELLIDIGRYSNVVGVDTLICFIYDPLGKCRNPRAIESDIENGGSRLNVKVVVCPIGL